MRTLSIVTVALLAAGLSIAAPVLAADGQERDARRHGLPHQKPNGGPRALQPAPRQIPAPANVPARVLAPMKQPLIRAPQPAPVQAIRAPQVEIRRDRVREVDRSRQLDRRNGGNQRFEAPRRSDGDGRRHANRYGGHRRLGLGAGIVIIGGILGYEAYRGRFRDDVFERCDRDFPDFDYDSGSFENEDGDREVCPYLLD